MIRSIQYRIEIDILNRFLRNRSDKLAWWRHRWRHVIAWRHAIVWRHATGSSQRFFQTPVRPMRYSLDFAKSGYWPRPIVNRSDTARACCEIMAGYSEHLRRELIQSRHLRRDLNKSHLIPGICSLKRCETANLSRVSALDMRLDSDSPSYIVWVTGFQV